ncbi:MAG: immunoglobulin domain-containing protein, partial [Opitutaceae bacterium]|nr:immunoglobulin domain-containing protein [Opitutaceae bacterium]
FPVNLPVHLLYRLRWLHVPAALLITLLQRTPALKVAASLGDYAARSPVAQVLKAAVTLASLGALHARAGATTFTVLQGTNEIIRISTITNTTVRNPATGAVGTSLTPVAFTYTGTPSTPQYYRVTGQLPPGLSYTPGEVGGTVLAGFGGAVSISGTPTQGGTFTIQVQGFGTGGNGQPEPITFTISGGAATAPVFTAQPAGQTVLAGATVTLSATATGSPTPAFRWRRNGVEIAGATNSTLVLPNVQPADAGDYTVVASNSAGSVTSAPATLTVVAAGGTARLTNLSVRTAMAAGQTLIMGFTLQGGSKSILLRAVGPGLGQFGVGGVMADPRLALFKDSTQLDANDNWGGSAALITAFASVGAFGLPPASLDAALLRPMDGGQTAQVTGTGAGVVLVEAYDVGSGTTPRLVNVSARNRVGTGDDILIAGFTVSGAGSMPLLVRAVGPKLTAFGVGGVLLDPKLEIYNGAGVKVTENDNWTASLAATFSAVGAFALDAGSRDAALLTSLPPGSYTAQVSGIGGGTGEALVEIYEVR